MEYSTADEHAVGAGIQLFRLMLLFAIPVALVLVARYRAAWLIRAWPAAWLLLVVGALAAVPGEVGRGDIPGFLMLGVPAGLTVLWLRRTRRHEVLSRGAVQLVCAVGVNVGAVVLLVILSV